MHHIIHENSAEEEDGRDETHIQSNNGSSIKKLSSKRQSAGPSLLLSPQPFGLFDRLNKSNKIKLGGGKLPDLEQQTYKAPRLK